jgi:hypothetical protein
MRADCVVWMPEADSAGGNTTNLGKVVRKHTLCLSAQALDAQGRPVTNAAIRFVGAVGRFEGRVNESGLVTSGSTGTFPASVVATVMGTAPVTKRVEVHVNTERIRGVTFRK